MSLRVLIVDDEELARLRLKSLLAECQEPAVVEVAEANGAPAAVQWLASHQADVVLLDVQMPGASGTTLASMLRKQTPGMVVIFVTAHAEHAVEAFELNAVDYLTKPVRRERLQQALQRAWLRLEQQGAVEAPADAAADKSRDPSITVTDRGHVVRVRVADVLYLKAELKYVTLRTVEREYVLDDSLLELEQRLGPSFIRVHRNALVARHVMVELQRRVVDEEAGEGWAVRIGATDEWLAVSRRQVAAVREAMEA